MSKLACCLLIFLFAAATSSLSYQKILNKSIAIGTHNDVLSTVTMKGLNIGDDLTTILRTA